MFQTVTFRKMVGPGDHTNLVYYEDPDIDSIYDDDQIPKNPEMLLRILAEHAIVVQFTVDMNDGHSHACQKYLQRLKELSFKLTVGSTKINRPLWERYVTAVTSLIYGRTFNAQDIALLLKDTHHYPNQSALSIDFVSCYFHQSRLAILGKDLVSAFEVQTPQCLQVYKCNMCDLVMKNKTHSYKHGEALVVDYVTFPTMESFKSGTRLSNNPAHNYVLSFNWDMKSVQSFVDTLQSYGCVSQTGVESLYSIPAMLHKAMFQMIAASEQYRPTARAAFQMIDRVVAEYHMTIDPEAMLPIAWNLGYTEVEKFQNREINNVAIAALEQYSELHFLKSAVLRVALEAVEAEEKEEEEKEEPTSSEEQPSEPSTEPDDADPLEDDPESDPEPEDSLDDTGDEFGSDAPDDSGSSDVKPLTDIAEPEDEIGLNFKVQKSETMSDYFYRRCVAQEIRQMVVNPSGKMSSETISFLKWWMTHWLYLTSVETTKKLLSTLIPEKFPWEK